MRESNDIEENKDQRNHPVTFEKRMRKIGPIICWSFALIMIIAAGLAIEIVATFDPQDDYLNIGEFLGKGLSFLGLIFFGLIAFFSAIIGIVWFAIGASKTKKEEAEQALNNTKSSYE